MSRKCVKKRAPVLDFGCLCLHRSCLSHHSRRQSLPLDYDGESAAISAAPFERGNSASPHCATTFAGPRASYYTGADAFQPVLRDSACKCALIHGGLLRSHRPHTWAIF